MSQLNQGCRGCLEMAVIRAPASGKGCAFALTHASSFAPPLLLRHPLTPLMVNCLDVLQYQYHPPHAHPQRMPPCRCAAEAPPSPPGLIVCPQLHAAPPALSASSPHLPMHTASWSPSPCLNTRIITPASSALYPSIHANTPRQPPFNNETADCKHALAAIATAVASPSVSQRLHCCT